MRWLVYFISDDITVVGCSLVCLLFGMVVGVVWLARRRVALLYFVTMNNQTDKQQLHAYCLPGIL